MKTCDEKDWSLFTVINDVNHSHKHESYIRNERKRNKKDIY